MTANGWRLNQPKVTLLASAFFVEWTLPSFSVASNKKIVDSKNPANAGPPFIPEPEALHFTCEWKAASSLDSTKLEFKGDTTCCLVPIEWAEEDVVMRLSFRFVEPILLPDGSRAPTTTIFDGERCIVRARRASAMPLLIPHASSTKTSSEIGELPAGNNSNNLAGVTCAQVLRAHPGLVDAFSLSLLRRGNDLSQLECGPWLGSMKALMQEIENDDNNNTGSGEKENGEDDETSCFETPLSGKKYHGCTALNGIKLDVWEVTYKKTAQHSIDFSFFTTEHENSLSPRHHRRSSTASPTFNSNNPNNNASNTASPQQAALFASSGASSPSLQASATFPTYHEQVEGKTAAASPTANNPVEPSPSNINNINNDEKEDTIIFLCAHDGLDEVDTFENRKLTDRLNPLNITKAFSEEWLSKPNTLICVCGAFSFGQFAVLAAEQLLREYESKKAKDADCFFYSKPRVVCATFASNPPRLSQADTSGRLRKKDNIVIRSQNHFLHVAPIIEAPVVAPDDLPNVEAAGNARRSRSLDFVDYFLGECASFAVGKNFLSIVLESYLERQNSYDQHSVMMTSQGTAEVVNPILSMANAVGAATGNRSAAENELSLTAACESPWIRSVMDETASSSGFTPLDVVSNIPELVRERSLMQKANIPDNLTSVFSSSNVLNAFESSLQQHLVAAACEEPLADAALRCEPVITSAEIKPTRLRMAELALVIQGTNLQFARHVVLRDSSSPRDSVFPRSEVEVPIRERTRGFDGFTCKVHPASLLRFVEEITEEEEYQYSGKKRMAATNNNNNDMSSKNNMNQNPAMKKNMFASTSDDMMSEEAKSETSTQAPQSPTGISLVSPAQEGAEVDDDTETPLSPVSRQIEKNNQTAAKGKKQRTRLVARFDVCVWAENGCSAFVDVIASFPDGLVPWMHNSGSWTSKQNNFLSPPVELISSAARLHVWGSFASSMNLAGGAPLAGSDLPRRLLKGLESASVSLSVVNPQDKSSNFFSRAFKSAKDKLASDPLTMQNAPPVPANLKLAAAESLLKDIPAGAANSYAASASRARMLHQQSTETRELKKYLDPLLQTFPWLNTGSDYRSRVLRSAMLLEIPFENSWYQQKQSQSSNNKKKNLNNTVPVIEALLWHHVSSLLQACGAKIQDSITEITLKSFCETIGIVLLRHDSFAGKKESDGALFFGEMMMIWIVCLMHELRAFASGTTLVMVTGERGSGASSVASILQNVSSSSLRNTALPHSFTWVVDLYPIPDLFGEALLLFPNVALLFVTTMEDCAKDTDIMQLTTTTNSLIHAQRQDVDPASWNRHHQWVILNKIDTIAGVAGEGDNKINQRVKFAREEFAKKCCASLRSWNAMEEKHLIPLAVNPQFGGGGAAGAEEIAELRFRAADILKDAVQKISIW